MRYVFSRVKSIPLLALELLRVILWNFKHGPMEVLGRDSIHDIDYDHLAESGITLLIFDLDETLTDTKSTIPKLVMELLSDWSQRGDDFHVCILTNTTPRRLHSVKHQTNGNIWISNEIPKPLPSAFKIAMDHFNKKPTQTCVVGDRYFTDMWGAHRSGCHKMLVTPYTDQYGGRKHALPIRIARRLENRFVVRCVPTSHS